jgi:hypothetical protein
LAKLFAPKNEKKETMAPTMLKHKQGVVSKKIGEIVPPITREKSCLSGVHI